jgi:hypothetical protein
MRPTHLHLHLPGTRDIRHFGAGLQHLIHGRAGEVIFGVAVVLLILIVASGWNNGPGR